MDTQAQITAGMTTYGSDGEKVGKIVEVGSAHVVVEKGFFFPTDFYVPLEAIVSADADNVYLAVTKDEALNQNWGEEPAGWGDGSAFQETASGQADPLTATNAAEVDAPAGAGAAETEVIAADYVAAADRVATGDEALRVPVYEEDIQAVTRDVERGAVRIEKELVTEERTVTVPVTEERVRVTRVDANDPNAVGADAFEDGAIEVPVRGQEVDVEKTARKAGEVLVEKEAVTRTEEVGGTVRREEVRVEDGTVEVDRVDDDRR